MDGVAQGQLNKERGDQHDMEAGAEEEEEELVVVEVVAMDGADGADQPAAAPVPGIASTGAAPGPADALMAEPAGGELAAPAAAPASDEGTLAVALGPEAAVAAPSSTTIAKRKRKKKRRTKRAKSVATTRRLLRLA